MAWTDGSGQSRLAFGTCGNFKFEFYDLTDIKATRSLIKPGVNQVQFVASTNETDNADVLAARTLNWTGNADADDENQLTDGDEVYDKVLTGLTVYNVEASDTDQGVGANAVYADANTLNLTSYASGAATDIFKTGDEAYSIITERVIQVIAADADDDGTLFVLGR